MHEQKDDVSELNQDDGNAPSPQQRVDDYVIVTTDDIDWTKGKHATKWKELFDKHMVQNYRKLEHYMSPLNIYKFVGDKYQVNISRHYILQRLYELHYYGEGMNPWMVLETMIQLIPSFI